MNSNEGLGLSSLAISVSAAALLGLSSAANSGDDPNHCTIGNACSLGYWQYFQGLLQGGIPWTQIPTGYWPSLQAQIEGFMDQYYGIGGYWPTGTCVFTQPSGYTEPTCGCAGYAMGLWGDAAWTPPDTLVITPVWLGQTIFRSQSECYVP